MEVLIGFVLTSLFEWLYAGLYKIRQDFRGHEHIHVVPGQVSRLPGGHADVL